MADLNGDERGQLLLVAALVLALVFIGLALVVNSAIFTENLASRGEMGGSDEALAARATVEMNAEKALRQANYYSESDGENETVDSFNRTLRNVSTQTEYLSATSGTLVNVTYVSHRNGTRINGSIDQGDNNYTVANDVERISGVNANGTRGLAFNSTGLPDGSDPPLVVKVNDTNFGGDEQSWRARIWENSSGVQVRTIRNGTTPSENRTEHCSVPSATENRIQVTAGLVNDRPCDALRWNDDGENFWFGNGVLASGSEYAIHFENTNGVSGEFEMVVYEDGLSLPLLSLPGDATSSDAIYDTTVRFVYDGPDVRYNTTVRIAPGEPDV
ncbi:DUF7261 family protein [Haloarcula nitratireducens]|uniref:Flagellin n=1 Tax=Haloarcula nitratireducens TaxID=2487749 RepID=A0AAW4P9R9_9EURY|nr:hypothetical protein [Halomicroarcula nitratireducens]MBX0294692.1 hypothetical protein [Halomicroarcula nitratireducens]